jgi:hypothetical protein
MTAAQQRQPVPAVKAVATCSGWITQATHRCSPSSFLGLEELDENNAKVFSFVDGFEC